MNWDDLKNKKQQLLDNELNDWHNYLWGAKQKWHTWDSEGNFLFSKPKVGSITTEKDWV
jgi:hypothetical protein